MSTSEVRVERKSKSRSEKQQQKDEQKQQIDEQKSNAQTLVSAFLENDKLTHEGVKH